MKASNKDIKSVVIKFNEKVEQDREKEIAKEEKKQKRMKFVTGVSITEEDKEKLRRVFSVLNRTRSLAIRYIKSNPKASLNEFKSLVMSALTSEGLPHVINSIVNQELYYIHRIGASGIDEVKPESKSLSFYEQTFVNNRFTINYRRDKIFLEDLDILLELDKPLPPIDETAQFYLNICVDDVFKTDYVYINVFYYAENKK